MVTTYNQCCAIPLDLSRTTILGLNFFLESKESDHEFWFFGKIRMGEPLAMVFQKPLKTKGFMKEYVILGVIISFLQKN